LSRIVTTDQEAYTMAQIDQVAPGIYRISTAAWGFPITLNQLLIEGEHPALGPAGEAGS
jgi:hypothetical protein